MYKKNFLSVSSRILGFFWNKGKPNDLLSWCRLILIGNKIRGQEGLGAKWSPQE